MTRPSDLSAYKSLSAFFIDRLQDWKDPRLEVFATQATNKDPQTGQEVTSFIGLPSGYDVEPTFTASSPNAANLATAPQDIQCLTYAEVLFIKAELAQRGLISDDAKLLYEKLLLQLLRNGELRFLTGILITGRQRMMERFAASWNRSSMHSSLLISSNGLSIIVPVILMYRKVQV